MKDKTQPHAGSTHIIRYALELGLLWIDGDGRNKVREALAALDALEAQLEAVSAGGVQALSAAPAEGMTIAGDGASALGRLMREQRQSRLGVYPDGNPNAMLAASPTPPAEQQAAPKAAPGVGNSGFDHKTAADFLSGKTVSDESVRKFVQASRWAHDEKAALSAMLLSVRGVLASREAEIALLKKALLEAEAAPQPAPAPLSDDTERLREALQRIEGASMSMYATRSDMLEHCKEIARAALAAQGGE